MRNTEQINSFEREFRVPNKEFTKLEKKNLKVHLEYTTEITNKYMRYSKVGTYHFENAYFRLNIPDYIYNYLFDKREKYTKDKRFTKILRYEKLTDLIKEFEELILDCLHLKKIEDLSKHNKVIFVKSNFINRVDIDQFNFGIRGNRLNLNYQFFVAYKVIKKKTLMREYWQDNTPVEDEVVEYYALDKRESLGKNDKQLPYLTSTELRDFKEIEWTEEREKFFLDIEMKINLISNKINNFVKDIDVENVDSLIDRNIKLLGDK